MRIGFSVLSRTALPDDKIGVGVVEHAPLGARWCGIDLERGDVVVYGPEAEHVAVNPAGMRFSFAVVSTEDVARTSDRVDIGAKVPKGSVERMPPSVATQRVRELVPRLPVHVPGTDAATALGSPELLVAVSDLLVTAYGDPSVSRRLSDSRVVLACIEYAERAQRIPTLAELGEASHVSERRVRTAFRLTHDMAPHEFFLLWGLDLARRRLIASDPTAVTVAWIACGAGFTHLGRFARYYKQQYGESPSVTLRRELPGEKV
jgi:AraC-like DNA-binding protein